MLVEIYDEVLLEPLGTLHVPPGGYVPLPTDVLRIRDVEYVVAYRRVTCGSGENTHWVDTLTVFVTRRYQGSSG